MTLRDPNPGRPTAPPARRRPSGRTAPLGGRLAWLLVAPLIALAALGCEGTATSADPAAPFTTAVRSMPPGAVGQPLDPGPDGSFLGEPRSARLEPGVPYEYEVLTHCGFNDVSFDLDGSFWAVDGPRDDGQGNPLPGLRNPVDLGAVVLVGPNQVLWRSQDGILLRLTRFPPGPRRFFPCD